ARVGSGGRGAAGLLAPGDATGDDRARRVAAGGMGRLGAAVLSAHLSSRGWSLSGAAVWARPTCPALSGWHEPYAKRAAEMWSSEKIRKSLRDLLWLDRRGKPRHEVVLAHSCRHFGECYPLNRLAALLMARAFAGAQGMSDTSAVVWE